MTEKIKVGIVGTGYTIGIAGNHLKGYQDNPHAEIVAFYDIVSGRAAKWAEEKKMTEVTICNSYDELLELVDAVSICTPNYAHVPLIVRAIEKGKHVLCEKPLSISYEEGHEAVKYAKCSDVVSMIGLSYRGIPAVRYMKKLIEEGKLGKLYAYRHTLGGARIANPEVLLEWRMQKDLSGTGALADFGAHMVDLADYFFRDTEGEICEVNGIMNTLIPERKKIGNSEMGVVTNDDCAIFNAKTEKGALMTFMASRIGALGQIIEIIGAGGIMIFRDTNVNQIEVKWKDINGGYKNKPEILAVPGELITTPWFNYEINCFIEAILNKKKIQPDLERGLYVQKILDTIEKSTEEGKTIRLK